MKLKPPERINGGMIAIGFMFLLAMALTGWCVVGLVCDILKMLNGGR